MKSRFLYESKDEDYFNKVRFDLIPFFTGKNLKVLEIGSGSGATLKFLKEKSLAQEIVGVEISQKVARLTDKFLDKLYVGNIEEMDLPYEKYFDYILLADVIEHLVNPSEVIKKSSRYLKDNGFLICSIPNLRSWPIFRRLFLRGEFEYQKEGLLDEGHLRFFTLRSIEKLMAENGFQIVNLKTNRYLENRRQVWLDRFIRRLAPSLAQWLFVLQYLIKAGKK